MDLKILTGTFNGVVMAEKFYSGILLWLVAGLVLGAIVGLVLIQMQHVSEPQGNTTQQPSGSNPPENGTAKTAVIDIKIIKPPDCPECRPLDEVMPQLRNVTESFNITIGTVVNISASEGAALISKYGIKKLPAMVVTGNFSEDFASWWAGGPGTRESDGALVLRDIYPPYYENGTTVGVVKGIAIGAPGCPKCVNPADYFVSLQDPSVDVRFSSTSFLQGNDTAAQALIAKYNITKLPVLLLSDDVQAYPMFSQYIQSYGEMIDGWFILRSTPPPYVDVQTGKVHGLVEAVFIVNTSCSDCFNASGLSDYLAQGSSVTVVNTTTYEANSTEGKALMAKYGIHNLPAILYSPEASAYSAFTDMWLQRNCTVESDGWYVFRGYGFLSVPYQNVTG